MKRVIAMVITLGLAFTLFAFNVNAATASILNRKTTSYTSGSPGIQISVTAYQGYPYSFGTSLLGGYGQDTVIWLRLYNSTAVAKEVSGLYVTPNYSTTAVMLNIENISSDLQLGNMQTNGNIYVFACGDYAFSQSIIVPATSSLYLMSVVTMRAEFDTANQTVTGPALSSIAVSTPTISDFSGTVSGMPVDLSSVETYLQRIYNSQSDLDDAIDDIKSQLTFTGTFTPVTDAPIVQRTFNFSDMGATLPNGVTGSLVLKRLSGFALNETAVAALGSYTYQGYTYVRPYLVNINISNNTDHAISSNLAYFNFENIFDRIARPSIVTYGLNSSLVGDPNILFGSGDWLSMQVPLKYSYDGISYIPKGNYVVSFYLMFIFESVNTSYSYNIDATMSNVFSTSNLDLAYNTESAISEINNTLKEIYNALQSGSYSGTIDDSEDLQDQEAAIHQQEAQWYSDNQTAIEATGLGNYQYNNGFISAFGIARQQISMLWNALGDWTYVYYLVFLLGLATYILRHEPTMKAKQARAAAAQAQKERTEYYRSHKK